VLAPVDLTPSSDRVLARVAMLPLAEDAAITVLHVVPSGLSLRDQQSAARAAKKQLEGEVRQLARSLPGTVSVVPVVAIGSAAKEISARAGANRAELIVMGRGGRRPFRDAFLGSTAERVTRRARIPVLVVRLPARDCYRRPALALDLDDAATRVVGTFCRILPSVRSPVLIIHAFADPYRGMVHSHLTLDAIQEREQELRRQAWLELEKLLARAVSRARVPPEQAPVWKAHVRYGSPRTMIEAAVNKTERDLLVLGSRGHSGVAQMFLGTVAGDVLREVRCDVLVVPPGRSKH
jgi:nucleotide-binding universal stress UspA family protein